MTIEEIRHIAQAQYIQALQHHDTVAAYINAVAVAHCYHEEDEWEQKFYWRGRARGALDVAEKIDLAEKEAERHKAYTESKHWNEEMARISRNAKNLLLENRDLKAKLGESE